MEYPNLLHLGFREIDISDHFFDSLKEDYEDFENWYERKKAYHEDAYVQYDNDNNLQGFLYIKMEENKIVEDVIPYIEGERILKVGTFKIDAHGTRMGEQFLKVLFDYAIDKNADVCYVTIFEKHTGLINLIRRYGFKEWGIKVKGGKKETVFLKNMRTVVGDVFVDYPLVTCKGSNKYLLSVYPKYHSLLFPESILTNENRNIIKDISYTNSIQKNYVCSMQGVEELKKGDLLVMYRTAENGRTAEYSAVATTVCTVTDVRKQDSFINFEEFYSFTSRYSVFDRGDLEYWYRRGGLKVISLVYNFPLKKRIVRHELIEKIGLKRDIYWGFFQLSDEEFVDIVMQGQAIEYLRQDKCMDGDCG